MVAWAGIERIENKLVVPEGDIEMVMPIARWDISDTLTESVAKEHLRINAYLTKTKRNKTS